MCVCVRACVRASFLVFKCAVEFKIASGDLSQTFWLSLFVTFFVVVSAPLAVGDSPGLSLYPFSSLSRSDHFQHVSTLNDSDLRSVC